MNPEDKPKVAVNSATPMAAAMLGNSYSAPSIGKTTMKIGAKIAEPEIPLNVAVVATHIATGNMNQ